MFPGTSQVRVLHLVLGLVRGVSFRTYPHWLPGDQLCQGTGLFPQMFTNTLVAQKSAESKKNPINLHTVDSVLENSPSTPLLFGGDPAGVFATVPVPRANPDLDPNTFLISQLRQIF